MSEENEEYIIPDDDCLDDLELEKIEEEEQNELVIECESQSPDKCIIEDDTDFDILFKSSINKHKIDGKHALIRDTILKGKENEVEEEGMEENLSNYIETGENTSHYQLQSGSLFELETHHNQEYLTQKNLSQDVFRIMSENTTLDFRMNRRKPNRSTFNSYYKMLLDHLEKKYSQSEIFVELSYYFTDNIFNMFKLLDKRYATSIILELKNKGYLKDISDINFV